MARAEDITLEVLRDRAWRTVEAFVDRATKEALPVQLEEFARATSIKRVRFEPLLSVAGLAKLENGLEIVVNTEADGVHEPAGTIIDLDRWASIILDSSLRFTIAHEIAHAIVLASHDGNWRSDIFRKNQRAIENLCNRMAAELLMPKKHLAREVDMRPFDASHLVAIAGKFCVSTEAFVRRLKQSDVQSVFVKLHGFVVFLSKESGEFAIVCSHVSGDFAHKRFDSFFDWEDSEEENDGEDSLPPANSLLRTLGIEGIVSWLDSADSDSRAIRIVYRADDGSTVPCTVSFCRVHRSKTNSLFCLEITEPPGKL